MLHVRICAGGIEKPMSLPRSAKAIIFFILNSFVKNVDLTSDIEQFAKLKI